MTAQQSKGLGWVLAATVISGFSVFINGLVVKGIDPLVHTTVKNSVAGLLVLATIGLTATKLSLTKKQWLQLGLIAVIGGSIPFALFFTGLKEIGAVQGTLIQKTMVVWVTLLAWPLLKEKLSAKMLVGVGLLYASSLVYGLGSLTHWGKGHGLVLVATLLWSAENILAKKVLARVPANVVVGARMGAGSVILAGMLVATQKAPLLLKLTGMQWVLLAGVGVILFGYVMTWYRALAALPATVVTSVLVGATVITSLLQAGFITHAVKPLDLLQSVMIVAGIAIIVRLVSLAKKPEKTAKVLEWASDTH